MFKDLRYAYRLLRLNPGFALTAIISIALAIGANSAIFSFQDALLLRPLAVKDPAGLVTVASRTPSGGFEGFPYPDFVELRDNNKTFDSMVAYRIVPAGFSRDDKAQPRFTVGFLVTGNFFDSLGVQPLLGRTFRADEDLVPGRDAVVVLGYDFWKNEFAGDRAIIGRRIRLGRAASQDFTVIGVAPKSFTGMDLFIRPSFFMPVSMGPGILGLSADVLKVRSREQVDAQFFVKGRLRQGVTMAAADADVSALAKQLEQTYPETNQGRGAALRTEMQARLDGSPLLGGIVSAVFGLMIVILLIACANVMNLMLGRGRTRAREIAICLSMGATRVRLIRQLMAESLLIALAGGGLGLLMAQQAAELLSRLEIVADVPIKLDVHLDLRVLVFTAVVSIASAVLFGLVPALRSTRPDLAGTLKAGESSDAAKRFRGRNILVAVQIAGSILLVMAAAQMLRNTQRVLAANPGFTMDHRLTMRLDPGVAGLTQAQSEQFYRTLLERVRQTPGIRSAALVDSVPFTSEGLLTNVVPEGYQFPVGQTSVRLLGKIADEHYFETLSVPLLAGRGIAASDRADSPRIAVVNAAFAERFFAGNAVGKRVRLNDVGTGTWAEVVGVTVTGKYQSSAEPPVPVIYVPLAQVPRSRLTVVSQTAGEPAAMAPALREIVRSINPDVPIFAMRTMEDIFRNGSAGQLWLFNAVFSSTALMGFFLAVVGLYAVVAYQVSRRTREIGIRMALGAERRGVLWMILRQSATVAGIGIVVGLGLSIAARPALLATLGRPSTGFDPILFGCVPLALLGITLLAAAIPARRASRIDPQRALRYD